MLLLPPSVAAAAARRPRAPPPPPNGITPLSPEERRDRATGTSPTFKFRANGAGAYWVHVCKSKKKDKDGVICDTEAIGQAKKKRRHLHSTSRSSTTSRSSG